MGHSIREIEGIDEEKLKALTTAGVKTADDLLKACGTAKDRATFASTTGIAEKELLQLANLADLMRINGVGREWAELLEAAGVDTVKELKHRRPENLLAKMTEVNGEKKLCKRLPTAAEVGRWVEQAKELTPALSH